MSQQGRFVWYELETTDVQGATAFYGDVVGWGTEPFEASPMPYSMWTAERPVGGVLAAEAGARPRWIAYVAVDDVDAAAKRAESLGGKTVVAPDDIPEVGRSSVIADPHGAMLGLFAGAGPEMPSAPEGTSRHFAWHELVAGELDSAFRFYSQLFGWEKIEAMDMGAMGTYQIYGKDGRPFGGMMTKWKEYPWPPSWLYYVRVGDLDATTERAKRGGGQVLMGPAEVPGGDRIIQGLDPQGAPFALVGK